MKLVLTDGKQSVDVLTAEELTSELSPSYNRTALNVGKRVLDVMVPIVANDMQRVIDFLNETGLSGVIVVIAEQHEPGGSQN